MPYFGDYPPSSVSADAISYLALAATGCQESGPQLLAQAGDQTTPFLNIRPLMAALGGALVVASQNE